MTHGMPTTNTQRSGEPDQSGALDTTPQAEGTPRRTLSLAKLLDGAQSIDINHNGHVYRLQLTKAGKLILTK